MRGSTVCIMYSNHVIDQWTVYNKKCPPQGAAGLVLEHYNYKVAITNSNYGMQSKFCTCATYEFKVQIL